MVDALLPHARLGRPILGLEPSCLFTLRDEFKAILPGGAHTIALRALLIEEFLNREADAGRLRLPLAPLPQKKPCCTATTTRRRSQPWPRPSRRCARSRIWKSRPS
jgi:hypothetical protein